MLVCRDAVPVSDASAPVGKAVEEWVTKMDTQGVRVTGDPLDEESAAFVVRVRDGEQQVTSGPFLKTEGALLGFDLLDCRDKGEAIEVAAAHPLARRCVLELRPISED